MLDRKDKAREYVLDLIAEEPEAEQYLTDELRRSLDEVDAPEWASIYLAAWSTLRDDRTVFPSGGVGGIHYSSISRYARDCGLSGADFRAFVFFVRALDSEYVNFIAEQLPKPGQT